MKQKHFDVLPIPVEKLSNKPRTQATNESISKPRASIKTLIEINIELTEKLKDYAYSKRKTQPEVIINALEEFLSNNPVEPRPESVKNKSKVGRKRKS